MSIDFAADVLSLLIFCGIVYYFWKNRGK